MPTSWSSTSSACLARGQRHCRPTERDLIGDDEHGWSDEGLYTVDGGCYANTINPGMENDPDIYNAIRTNVMLEKRSELQPLLYLHAASTSIRGIKGLPLSYRDVP
ncbi:hypothetical protein PHYPSEUDO_014106 [Phytophthora pseudosyringae]|uniref:Phosphoenolpyruvate carboxykinase (ATP) n=1 Tax=Phytophthora pseudosyringae TaxID=221518 RepID=A0A8T1W4C2_9STRA|nr:hypothetical protein PHYPSEUDO_014106 [Phytophthora pseudosyringae]